MSIKIFYHKKLNFSIRFTTNEHIYNYFVCFFALLNSIFIRKPRSTLGLIGANIPISPFSLRRQISFVIVENAKVACINHLLIALDIGCLSRRVNPIGLHLGIVVFELNFRFKHRSPRLFHRFFFFRLHGILTAPSVCNTDNVGILFFKGGNDAMTQVIKLTAAAEKKILHTIFRNKSFYRFCEIFC